MIKYACGRFVGPATTVAVHCSVPPRVEVRTAGQAVAELGRRLSRLVLTQQQLDILTRDQPLTALLGGPGTGQFFTSSSSSASSSSSSSSSRTTLRLSSVSHQQAPKGIKLSCTP
jgi:hypothetical protein